MSFMVSPGVEVREIDLTGYIPAVSTSIGAYAGHFRWGPVNEVVRVNDEKQLARNFGTPTPEYASAYYVPSTFLRYGQRLVVSRSGDDDMENARTGNLLDLNTSYYETQYESNTNIDDLVSAFVDQAGGTDRIENKSIFESLTPTALTSNIYARCMGEMGNSLKVMIQPAYTNLRWNVVEALVESTYDDDPETPDPALGVTLVIQDQITGEDEESGEKIYAHIKDHSELSLRGISSSHDWLTFLQAQGRSIYVKALDSFIDDDEAYGPKYGIAGAQYTSYRVYIDNACTVKFNPATVMQVDRFGRTFGDMPVEGDTEVIPAMSEGFAYWPPQVENFESAFVTAPGTSAYAEERGIQNDEIHVLIVDAGGEFTGTTGTILETYENVSVLTDAKRENGESAYYKDVINEGSRYIFFNSLDGVIANADISSKAAVAGNVEFSNQFEFGSVYAIRLAHGVDGSFKNGNTYRALEMFEDPEEIDVNLIFAENDTAENITIANKLIRIAERRKDCVAFISPDIAVKDLPTENDKLERVLRKFNRLPSTSYAVFDSTPIQVYDKYNDEYIWTAAAGTVAGLCARTDQTRDPWWSPAGYSRGQLLGVAKIAFNPKQFSRDELYKSRVNPLVSFPGEGTLLYGDKTAQARPSAFDRINVRRLFIVLQKAIATAAKYSLFEFNDEFTRAQFKNMVDPYLRDVQGRRGIYDFEVVCDERNNTPQIIDTNRFVADIYIKPARAINFISLNFIATRTGVEFSEVIGKW